MNLAFEEKDFRYRLYRGELSHMKAMGYSPLHLTEKEDRDFIRDKWLVFKYSGNFAPEECKVIGFSEHSAKLSIGTIVRDNGLSQNLFDGEDLLALFTFLDGTPVGRKKEAD